MHVLVINIFEHKHPFHTPLQRRSGNQFFTEMHLFCKKVAKKGGKWLKRAKNLKIICFPPRKQQ